jgi:hypothetical protein
MAVKWRRRRKSRAASEGRESSPTIGDVGRGIYGPDPTTQPVWRFERVRKPAKRRQSA